MIVSRLCAFLLLGASASAKWTAIPFTPASVPLAVRSPYTSTWLPAGPSGGSLSGTWPQLWTGATTGWAGYVRVDGKAYVFLGNPIVTNYTIPLATQTALTITATTSTFVLQAGPVAVTATFFSPIEATNFTLGSLPFSYLSVSTKSTDGNAHLVQVYTDISGEWVSTTNTKPINWSTHVDAPGGIIAHQAQLQNQTTYGESGDIVESGSIWYGTQNVAGVTYMTGADVINRAAFITQGSLPNTLDTNYRPISQSWPVFSYSKTLGSVVDTTNTPVIFGVGHARSPSITYVVAGNKMQDRFPYYAATWNTPLSALQYFLSTPEYSRAMGAGKAFDSLVVHGGSKISSNYTDLLIMASRQVMGAIEVTISKTSSGAYNVSDTLAFMKEISSDGNVNTVDIIFPAWSFFLYASPKLGALLLEPLFRYQQTGLYPNRWSVHDMGANYPVAGGHSGGADEAMPVEECGNMVIMALSYAQKTKDNSQLSANYNLLTQWTGYLVSDSLIPANQISTDDFEGALANQTNLAIKGTTAIRAMGQIATILGKSADATKYNNIAASYVPQILKFAMASTNDHLELAYGSSSTWGLMYNLFADKLCDLNLWPSSLYTMQTNWYSTHASTWGTPLDTRHTNWAKGDWMILTSTTVTSNTVRDQFIGNLAHWAANGNSKVPFSDWYDCVAGTVAAGFRARPAVGGFFAHLVLPQPVQDLSC